MRDVPEKPFVCPNRECHRKFTADAHTIANTGSKLIEARRFLKSAAELMGGSHASQQFEDQCGYLADQINLFLNGEQT